MLCLSVCRKQFFADVAEVVDARLACHEDGHPKGFGHVEFATVEDAEKVIFRSIYHHCWYLAG